MHLQWVTAPMQQVAEWEMSGCHSWRGCSPFVLSLHGTSSTGRQCCCLSLPQAVSISHEPWVGTVLHGMVWRGLTPGCPPGWCQLRIGPSLCQLGHRQDSLKDMSAHSLALLGSVEPDWGHRLRAGVLNRPGALLSLRCWVMLTRRLTHGLQQPDSKAFGGLWVCSWMNEYWCAYMCGCWLFITFKSRKYPFNNYPIMGTSGDKIGLILSSEKTELFQVKPFLLSMILFYSNLVWIRYLSLFSSTWINAHNICTLV